MHRETVDHWCLGWPQVEAGVKWGEDWVYTVAGKMFCVLGLSGDHSGQLSFKVSPERFLEFTDRHGFRPAPYMARAHWVSMEPSAEVSPAEVRAWVAESYRLVVAKMTRKAQRELQASPAYPRPG